MCNKHFKHFDFHNTAIYKINLIAFMNHLTYHKKVNSFIIMNLNIVNDVTSIF